MRDLAPQPRLGWQEFKRVAPKANAALLALGEAGKAGGIEPALIEIVKVRVSQINGCAFCVAYHVALAQTLGVPAQTLHMVAVWRDSPLFGARERAALGWAEALTALGHGVSDEIYAAARAAFSDSDLAALSAAVAVINAWNRIAVAYRFEPLPIPAPQERAA